MGRRAAAAALASLAGLAAAACVGPAIPREGLVGWHAIEVGDVRLVSDAPTAELEGFAADLAAFDAAFTHLIGRRLDARVPTAIHLVRGPGIAEPLHLGRGVAGWAFTSLEGSFACVHVRGHPLGVRRVLFHEYTHLLLARNRRVPLPHWYNEGLAVYFSTLTVRDGALVVGAAPTAELLRIAGRGPMPLERLFGEKLGRRWDDVHDYYATAWALVHFLLSSPDGRRELARFEAELARGATVEEARLDAFGRSLDALSEELTIHVGYLARGVPAAVVLDPRRIAIAEPPAPAPLAPAEVARELGAMLLELSEEGDTDLASLARALLEAAAEEDAPTARTRADLAAARAASGDLDAARSAIDAALREASGDAHVHRRAGRVALAADAPGDAQARYRRALELDAYSAAAWFGLGRAQARAGAGAAAVASLERARGLAWSPVLDLELGRLHLEAGRRVEALALLWPIARNPHGGDAAEQADALLRDADLAPEAGSGAGKR